MVRSSPSTIRRFIIAFPTRSPKIRDERWVLCNRPAVLVGGELTAEMLDLEFNPLTKYYVGPVQMKANNGVLIIDDFGRQRLRPEELLNRWVVPLDRRIDFLTLAGGKKIEIPFEMLVVFASNMDPAELVDPAFLRRIQTKIKIGEVTDEQFCEIFRRVAADRGIKGEAGIVDDLIGIIKGTLKQELALLLPARHHQPDLLGRAIRRQKALPRSRLPDPGRRSLLPRQVLSEPHSSSIAAHGPITIEMR